MVKHTDELHPDHANLQRAVEFVAKVAEELNEKIRKIENDEKMVQIERMFDKSDALVRSVRIARSNRAHILMICSA
jgi:CCR4-NOT transcriptional regulation complex NOT5 subunit